MGLSHLVATGDETSPDPIAVARKALSGSQGRSQAEPAADRVPEPCKNRAKTAKTPPWTPPGRAGITCIQSDVYLEPPVGFEPTAFSLREKRSTPELRRRTACQALYQANTHR